jgi:hypothetical protein
MHLTSKTPGLDVAYPVMYTNTGRWNAYELVAEQVVPSVTGRATTTAWICTSVFCA